MNYTGIKWCDLANGPGKRVSLFVSGCPHHCPGCFNAIAWDYDAGRYFSVSVEDEIISALQTGDYAGLSLLGGEPFAPANQIIVYLFLKKLRRQLPTVDIWAYSGYTYEQLLYNTIKPLSRELLTLCDVLVDGRYEAGLRNITLEYRGSLNQRIINIKQSMKKGEIFLWQK